MRMDRRGVSVDGDRIEVKSVGEAADDRELILVRGRNRARRWSSGFGVRVRRPRRACIRVREGQVVLCSHCRIDRLRRPGRNAHVERIDKPVVGGVVDADLSRRADTWCVLEGQLQLHIGIDHRRLIGREQDWSIRGRRLFR